MNTITKENIKIAVDNSISVVFHKFNSYCKEENQNKLFCFYEGKDAPYYSVRVRKYFDNNYLNFSCNNKKNVLKLYHKIKSKKENYLLAFFIDADFDERLNNADIYETLTYSVENLYCTEEALINIIKNEYYINELDVEFQSILILYREQLADYLNKILLFNSWYCSLVRKKRLENLETTYVSLDEKLPSDFLTLEICNIQSHYTIECIFNKFNTAIKVSPEEVDLIKVDFESRDLLFTLRGKYLMTFFIKFIEYLTFDSKNSKSILKQNINFSTNKTIFLSHLSNYATTPNCLYEYLKGFVKIPA